MKVLVIGGGGREHALVWKLKQSRQVDKVYCAPGNAGISSEAECLDIPVDNPQALLDFVKYEWVDLTVVGPEIPLSEGIVDVFEKAGRRIFGPTRAAAQLESSKVFAKDFMRRYGIPTAEYKVFSSYTQAEDYVKLMGTPIVIKANGLAAGKGVIICHSFEEAQDALRLIIKERAFGEAGDKVVVEQCLVGEEASFMAFCDGQTIVPMSSSQDHKRIFDGDKGPNTGGMGAYSPAPVVTPEVEQKAMERVMLPLLKGLRAEGITFKGVVYAGLMIDKSGDPSVLEFNCRFGDPEAQPILMRMETDLVDVLNAVIDERLAQLELKWRPESAVCVVVASGGYPGEYQKGTPIKGLEQAAEVADTKVFHAGTAFKDGEVVTSGGRVLGVTALGETLRAAKERAHEAIAHISFEGMQYRRDIGDKALRR